MKTEPSVPRRSSSDDGAEATERRRRILEHLQRQSGRMSESELAARIAADDPGGNVDVDDEEVRDLQVVLRHVDLPKAAAAGLVDWDAESGTIKPGEETELSETEARQQCADGWDDATAVAQDGLRRATLAALREAGGELSVTDLAAEVAAHEAEGDAAPAAGDIDEVGVAMHHRILPKLRDAGLVEYDQSEGSVVYDGPSEQRAHTADDDQAEWFGDA